MKVFFICGELAARYRPSGPCFVGSGFRYLGVLKSASPQLPPAAQVKEHDLAEHLLPEETLTEVIRSYARPGS